MSYESGVLRDWYLLFHYGTPQEILAGVGFDTAGLPPRCLEFPVATVDAAKCDGAIGRALDLGCAVGRSSFELSRIADETLGIDFSQSFIDAAEALRRGETLRYRRYDEMHLSEMLSAHAPADAESETIAFEQGDAMNLRESLGSFDLVHAANLLCRLTEPLRLLNRLPDLVKPGGKLVIATPTTWLEEYTPGENQPEGPTLEYLKHHLSSDFEFLEAMELPFLIREQKRKLQLSTSQTSRWVRK